MDERFEEHLLHPVGRDHQLPGAHLGAAGGAACGDLVQLAIAVRGDRVQDAGFTASGCGAVQAAGSAAVELVRGARVLDAALVGSAEVAAALGGLSVGKLHAADLAADALARALGAAVASDASAPDDDRVLVALSGGVDSAVAALLCRDQATAAEHPVAAVTVELWRDPDNDGERSCCSADAVRLARSTAHRLGLPHLTLDLREPFRAGVVDPWLAGHAEGQTPNPCVRCNGHVRLDAMLDLATRIGARTLATGHYARTTPDGLLRAGADDAKDQSYMLARLAPASLRRLRFPLGELTKPEVRARAQAAGLESAKRPDSQDLCFLAGTGRAAFLARHGGLADRPGEVVDRAGVVLAEHPGHHHFTVGQRRGIGVHGTGDPLYVLRTEPRANRVVVGPKAALQTREVPVRGVRLHRPATAVDRVRLRSHAPALACELDGDVVRLREPAAATAPGQQACLMAGDVVVGHATVARPATR